MRDHGAPGRRRLRGVMLVLGGAAAYAILPPLAKVAYEHGADSRGVLALRFCIAAPLLVALANSRRGGDLSFREFRIVFVPAVVWFFSTWAFFESLDRMSAVITVLVLFSYPIVVAVGGMIFLGEPLTRLSGALILLGSTGIYLCVGITGRTSATGLVLAASSSLLFAVFFLRAKHLLSTTSVDGIGLMALASVIAGVGFVALLLMQGGALPRDGIGWASLLAIALFGTVIGAALLYSGLRYLDAGTAAMLSTAEPPLTVLITAILLAEPVARVQIAGMAIVLISITGLSYSTTRMRTGIPPGP